MQQILKIRRSTLAQIFGIFYLLSITSWDLKVTHAHPVFFFSFYHYIIASPSSNQFIAIISFHRNEKATINHNLFFLSRAKRTSIARDWRCIHLRICIKKKIQRYNTLRNFETLRNRLNRYDDRTWIKINGFDFVKLNITVLSAIQLFILITL